MSPRRALILTYGSRGDVEPFLALAKGLQGAGLDVLFATSERFRDFVTEHGIAFFPLSDASLAAIETQDGKTMLEGGRGLTRRIAAGIRLARRSGPINDALMRQCWEAARGFPPDVIVFHAKLFAAPHIAEKLNVPAFLGALQPMYVPTRAFPAMGLPHLPFPGYNRLTYALVQKSIGAFRGRINRFRQDDLDLPPVRHGRDVLAPPGTGPLRVLHAYSPHLIPRPDDWPATAFITGSWRLDKARDYTPPEALRSFLERGAPPVFVGFGSMTSVDGAALGRLVTCALHKAGQRGVVAKGWANLKIAADETIISIPPAPYDWLFPQMTAVVHHGGAGTTLEAFHAGVPSVICPFFGDQPGWASLAADLGVATPPIPRRKLTENRLAAAIREAVTSERLRDNARQLGTRLRVEDGVAKAVEIITGEHADGHH
ncbi:glycosyltransferase [Jiella marina]|uniref:glycosyltransferase n=1 Tax=Jiella sp. LLJ827 TaxID=2917712 RepID=UPI002100C6A8|nr:glycosyltransferase [Jiella sp. LLJ827]MCQ0989196.1 glycosyltransferase [Jiella sp. LLJ827]